MRERVWKRMTAVLLALVLAAPAFYVEAVAVPAEEHDPAALLAFSRQLNAMIESHEETGPDSGESVLSIQVPEEFATARLVVKAEEEIDPFGAVDVVSGFRNLYVLQFSTPAEAYHAYQSYCQQESVVYVEPDRVYDLDPVNADNSADGSFESSSKDYYNSWGYDEQYMNMDAYKEWLMAEVGSVSALPDIVVAVLDTGMNLEHDLFEGRLVSSGYDFINSDADATDDHGHGSHVAGTVADGTFTNVKFLPVKVLNANGSGTSLQIAMGIFYAADQGVNVVNMSLGGSGYNWLEKEAIDYAVSKGITFVVAAGNDSMNAANHSPACFDNVITVAAAAEDYDEDWNLVLCAASYTNYGSVVDVTAPGTYIWSAYLPYEDWWTGEWVESGYTMMSGTSMATPHVAAAAAMLLSYNRDYTPSEIELMLEQACTIELYDTEYDQIPDLLCMASLIPDQLADLTISRATATGCVGQSFKLDAVGAGTTTWSSSDPAVASVDGNGTVTCLQEGTAVITASCGDKTVRCDLSVVELELKVGSLTLYPGGSSYLVCETNCDPAPALTWNIREEDRSVLNFRQINGAGYPVQSASVFVCAASSVKETTKVEVIVSFGDTHAAGAVTVALPNIDWYDPNTLEYHIQTEEQLLEMTHVLAYGAVNGLAGKTVLLDNDIELKNEWTVMTTFGGIFDGQGHTISGLTIRDAKENGVGMFGALSSTGVVKNLTLEDASVTTDGAVEYMYVGGIVGYSEGVIANCSFNGTIFGGNYVGGIVGYSETEQGSMLYGCGSSGTVSGISYAGGIVGLAVGPVEYCYNAADVNGGACVGGIAGYAEGLVSACVNRGTVSGVTYIGGVTGWGYGSTADCGNWGCVTGSGYVGGIAGYQNSAINSGENHGVVSGEYYVGGICGFGMYIVLTNCTNYGDVDGCGSVGGVIGYMRSYSDGGGPEYAFADSCSNYGDITGWEDSRYVGGIAGYGVALMVNCLNAGGVSTAGESWNVGGICGYVESSESGFAVVNCVNTGEISGHTNVGGIVGVNYYVDFENCVSLGPVSGEECVGYIEGRRYSGRYGGDIISCYAVSDVFSSDSSAAMENCAVVDADTLQVDAALTVGGYTGEDLLQLVNNYALEAYENKVFENDGWSLEEPFALCFWKVENGWWERAAAVMVEGRDLAVFNLNGGLAEDCTVFTAVYDRTGKMTSVSMGEFWDELLGTTYLIRLDVTASGSDTICVMVLDQDFQPMMEAITL